ncbi:MAG: Lrp/AsnC family transcriptional regulator [Treponema sp.]|nr:Lrp/AsnC family transcriptional regulator [Treponema sp.]
MEEVLALLKDGHSRSVEMLAAELNTSTDDILRRIEFLEHAGLIRKVLNTGSGQGCASASCSGCSGCSCGHNKKATCSGCLPDGGFKHMGQMWEVV